MAKQANNRIANLGIETALWAVPDKLRGNMGPSDYKHIVLGPIFLKYISDALEVKRAELLGHELADGVDPGRISPTTSPWCRVMSAGQIFRPGPTSR